MSAWHPIDQHPAEPVNVMLYHDNIQRRSVGGGPSPITLMRDVLERFTLGWWDGECWRERGTGHEVFEAWGHPDNFPTHWMPLPSTPGRIAA